MKPFARTAIGHPLRPPLASAHPSYTHDQAHVPELTAQSNTTIRAYGGSGCKGREDESNGTGSTCDDGGIGCKGRGGESEDTGGFGCKRRGGESEDTGGIPNDDADADRQTSCGQLGWCTSSRAE